MALTAHEFIALQKTFSPMEVISQTKRDGRAGTQVLPSESLHFDGSLDGSRINVRLEVGGIWIRPMVSSMAYECDGPDQEGIEAVICSILSRHVRRPNT